MRKVVVKQKTALDLAFFEVVHKLLVLFSAESGGNECLSFTTGEKCGAVNAWQPTNLATYRSNLREPPTIRPASVVENIVTKDRLLQMVEDHLRHQSLLRLIFGIRLDNFFLKRVDGGVAVPLFLAGGIQSGAQTIGVVSLNLAQHFLIQLDWSYFTLLDVQSFVQLLLPATEAIDLLVGEHERLDHDLF